MFEAPHLDEIGKGLLEAADLIVKRGWWDGSNFLPDSKLCAGMAICEVFHNDSDRATKAFERLDLHIGVKRELVPLWNDGSDAETVIRTLREAAYNK